SSRSRNRHLALNSLDLAPPRRIFRASIIMYTQRRHAARLLPIAIGLCLAITAVSSAPSARLTVAPEGRVAVRSGDPAPGAARVWRGFQSVATGPGGLLFIDAAGTALFRKNGDTTSVVVYVGQTTTGDRVIASLGGVAGAADGTVVFFATLADRGQGIFRVTPGGGPPEEVVLTNDILQLRDGPATVGYHSGAAVDA